MFNLCGFTLPSLSPNSLCTLQLCSLICDDREGRQALKKEHWDISLYNKLAREVGSQFDFEPRSTSKEVKGVRRGSKRKSSGKKKGSSKEKSSPEKKSPVSLLRHCWVWPAKQECNGSHMFSMLINSLINFDWTCMYILWQYNVNKTVEQQKNLYRCTQHSLL